MCSELHSSNHRCAGAARCTQMLKCTFFSVGLDLSRRCCLLLRCVGWCRSTGGRGSNCIQFRNSLTGNKFCTTTLPSVGFQPTATPTLFPIKPEAAGLCMHTKHQAAFKGIICAHLGVLRSLLGGVWWQIGSEVC